jgi:hypothetical protein
VTVTALAVASERPAVAGYASGKIAAAVSLIALLHYLANHGSDLLLISHTPCFSVNLAIS